MQNFEQIDIHKAKELMDNNKVIIADIRDQDSYNQAHIPLAISINENSLEAFLKQTDKSTPLICYCYHGHSSQSAAQYFKQQGFEKVFSVIGGFEEWRSHYPTLLGAS